MAAAIDLKTPATFPIRLGSSILKSIEGKRWASVRYNYRPRLKEDVTCKIRNAGVESRLELREGDEEYLYIGRQVGDGEQCILLPSKGSKEKEMILERVHVCREFNLVRTPTDDSSKLEEIYPQLAQDDEGEDNLFGEENDDTLEEAPVDSKNPFDYRNYLKSSFAKGTVRTTQPLRKLDLSSAHEQPSSRSSTLIARPTKRSDTPLIGQKKRRIQETSKPNPKRVKAGTEPPVRPDVPKLRIDRKASIIAGSSYEDSGELILDSETPVLEKPPRSMQLALNGGLTGPIRSGPMSLHSFADSAANSPTGGGVSSSPMPPEGIDEGEEFDIGGDSPETEGINTLGQAALEDNEEDVDADVEDLELGSPAQTHWRAEPELQTQAGEDNEKSAGADDDDDLDAQLAKAMAEEDDDLPPAALGHESDEESEEE